MGGSLSKLMIGAFFVALSSQMGELAKDVISRARQSVQASELMTLDGTLAAWAIEQHRTRGPRDQREFERTLGTILSARDRDVTKDRWNRSYVYEHIRDRPVRWRISSRGPDGQLGTDDDLVVERDGDRTSLSRDPVEIIEKAIERKQRIDRETLGKLRELVAKLKAQDASGPEPLLDAEAAERAARERSLAELDRLLSP